MKLEDLQTYDVFSVNVKDDWDDEIHRFICRVDDIQAKFFRLRVLYDGNENQILDIAEAVIEDIQRDSDHQKHLTKIKRLYTSTKEDPISELKDNLPEYAL